MFTVFTTESFDRWHEIGVERRTPTLPTENVGRLKARSAGADLAERQPIARP